MKIDPRILLAECLIKKGCKPDLAHLISVEAGSGQAFVDDLYLVELKITDKKERKKYLECIAKFYLIDDIDI